jgi:hypothetical protein
MTCIKQTTKGTFLRLYLWLFLNCEIIIHTKSIQNAYVQLKEFFNKINTDVSTTQVKYCQYLGSSACTFLISWPLSIPPPPWAMKLNYYPDFGVYHSFILL